VIRAAIDGASPVTPAPGMVPGANQEDDEMIHMNALADRIDQFAGKHPREEAFRILGREFPGLTVRQFRAAAELSIARARARSEEYRAAADALEQVHELCQGLFADGRAKTIGEAIDILAAEGDETAKALKAQLAA
jgi:hypothetical protein